MPINKLDHYSIRTMDVATSRDFYQDVVGLQVGPRPEFPFPGAWLYNGDTAVVHIVGIDPNDASGLEGYLGGKATVTAGDGTGSIDHIAFIASDIDKMREDFSAKKIDFFEREVPGLGLRQIFLKDPNGVTIELNFRVVALAAE
jgi:catechol 2,3-dioxygenase-like lactoylglutathione lyase family enzyme